jgi:hypothetical protein
MRSSRTLVDKRAAVNRWQHTIVFSVLTAGDRI